jgi:hypothetical protein
MTYWIGEHADIVTLSGEGRPTSSPCPDPLPPQQKTRAAVSGFLKLAGYLGGVFAVALLLLSAYIGYRVYDLLSAWPHVEAEIASCEVYPQNVSVNTSRSHPHSTVYGFRCAVSYTAASQTYQSQADIGYQKSDPLDMTRWSTRYYHGVRVPIAYKPGDPTHIRFAGDFTTAYAAALVTFPFAAGLFVACVLMIVVSRKLEPPAA